MITSDKLDLFLPSFLTAQKEMTGAKKDGRNPHFRCEYPTLESSLQACKPALNKNDISIVQSAEADIESIKVTTSLYHNSGQFIRSSLSLKPVKDDPQGRGSAITYARRYSILSLCGIAPADDDGNEACGLNQKPVKQQRKPKSPAKPKPQAPPPAGANLGPINAVGHKHKIHPDVMQNWFKWLQIDMQNQQSINWCSEVIDTLYPLNNPDIMSAAAPKNKSQLDELLTLVKKDDIAV